MESCLQIIFGHISEIVNEAVEHPSKMIESRAYKTSSEVRMSQQPVETKVISAPGSSGSEGVVTSMGPVAPTLAATLGPAPTSQTHSAPQS